MAVVVDLASQSRELEKYKGLREELEDAEGEGNSGPHGNRRT